MRTNVEDQVRIQEGILSEAKSQLLDFEADLRVCRSATLKAKQESQRWRNTAEELKVAWQKAEDQVDKLQLEVSSDDVQKGNLEVLHEALKQAKTELELHEGSYLDVTNNMHPKKKKMRDITQELNALDVRIVELTEESASAKNIYQKADQKHHHAIGEVNDAVSKLTQAQQDRETMNAKKQEFDNKVIEETNQARNVCERVNVPAGATSDNLKEQYSTLHGQLKEAQNRAGGTREVLEAEKIRTAQAYMDAKAGIDHMTLLSDTMQDTMHNRRRRWTQFQRFISVASKWNFSELLGEREFRGSLVLDHELKLLEIKIEPDITKKKGDGRYANTLSGGEKSFSQICLLLAIWEAMGSPIRCLDEFDVFMDAVNRSRSASMLIQGARRSTGKQFILISPGTKADIPHGPTDKDVRCIE